MTYYIQYVLNGEPGKVKLPSEGPNKAQLYNNAYTAMQMHPKLILSFVLCYAKPEVLYTITRAYSGIPAIPKRK